MNIKKEDFSNLTTIVDFLRYSTTRFKNEGVFLGHGTVSFWDEAVFIVAGYLSIPFEHLELCYNANLTNQERFSLIQLIEMRIFERKPTAYLINKTWFCGLEFYVDERVIIPRSPIAELIENNFSGLLPESQSVNRVLDMCAGSGCIGIACSYAFPEAEVDLVDISQDALDVAQINIESLDCLDHVTPIQSDLFENIPEGVKYDLIISNPPYVDQEDLVSMPSEFHHEPDISLDGGSDGLNTAIAILKQAADYLTENGVLIVEVGNSMLSLKDSFADFNFNWLDFNKGGNGVFSITRKELLDNFV